MSFSYIKNELISFKSVTKYIFIILFRIALNNTSRHKVFMDVKF